MNDNSITFTLIWCTIIFGFTSLSFFSGENTLSLLQNILRLEYNQAELLNTIIRKGAHICIFGLLAILIFLVLKRKHIALSWVITTTYALGDEYHQSLVPERSGSFNDVLLDSFAAFSLLVLYNYYQKTAKKIIIGLWQIELYEPLST
ncbi:VanZ family protein [Bacillus niacini]|uniref:VanZ family protein n=1 Tax=Neobacillus niacini TaxID=86668 RepID=A0A852T581_9BACI|nr:VanZ family protein [Neobacillus niacini]NYE03870.1 VanZ family protein [Neobacillus niacini]